MKRTLVLAALAAAAFTATPAQADHVCIYSEGNEVYCTRHLDKGPEPICVTSGGRDVICTP